MATELPPAVLRDLDNPWNADLPYWDWDLRSWFWVQLMERENNETQQLHVQRMPGVCGD